MSTETAAPATPSAAPSPVAAPRPNKKRSSARTRLARYAKRMTVAAVLLAFFGLLVLHGFVSGDIGSDSPDTSHKTNAAVPKEIIKGGPVLVSNGTTARPVAVPDKTMVLTFQDGPNPVWTPKILDVLEANGVTATFFMNGAKVSTSDDLARRVQRQGDEIGLQTFAGIDPSRRSDWRVDLEMSQSQLALAGAAGITTSLFRPPGSWTPSAMDDEQWAEVDKLASQGYVVAMSSIDSQDGKRPGVDAIVKSSTPAANKGGIVMMHDAGADESQTVAALKVLIPALKAKGYQFATIAQVLQQKTQSAASTSDMTRGRLLIWVVDLSAIVAGGFSVLLYVFGFIVAARVLIMLVIAGWHARKRHSPKWSWGAAITEPVSVIVPAYNEGPCIADTVRSLLASDHPIEIIVVDDGSTDDTADIAEGIGADNVRVVRKPNGGKSSALNMGIAVASHELIVMMDGDTVFEPETVGRLVQPFADASIGAVAGNAKVANRKSIIGGWQHIEYVYGFNIDRRVYDMWGCMPTIAGAVGAFRRSVLVQVGGLSTDTLAEDTDLTMAICRAGWRVVYEDSARAWTEAPSTLKQLWSQRYRWSYGTMQSMWKHRHALVESGTSGRFGRRGLVNLTVFQILLPLTSPLVDVFLVYGLLFLDPIRTLEAWLAMLAIQTVTAAYAFRLDRERLRALWLLPLQQFVYRQMMYFVLLQSVLSALSGIRMGWHKLTRTGGLGQILHEQRSQGTAS